MLGAFHDKFTSDKDPHDNLGTQLNPNLDALGNVILPKYVPQFDANQQKPLLEQELADQARERANQAVIDERNRREALSSQWDEDLNDQMENTAAMGGDPTHQLVQVLRDVNEGGVATSQVSSWELQKIPDVNLTIINTKDGATSTPMANTVRQLWTNDYWAGRGEEGI